MDLIASAILTTQSVLPVIPAREVAMSNNSKGETPKLGYTFTTLSSWENQDDAREEVKMEFALAQETGRDPVRAAVNACKRIRQEALADKKPWDPRLEEVIIEI